MDLSYVVEGESVEPLTPESGNDALEVYRHSTAHLMAAAVMDLYPGTKLGVGPALMDDPKGGFFYDFIAPKASVSHRKICRRSRRT